ncbi:MAG: response regulator transcription factor [Anaerolineae bacterium]|jgi:DNA-binding NarL/FixJ family response regulator
MIRVLVVDAQAEVRRGLRMRLAIEPDIAVVGETGEPEEALALTRSLNPDVVVIDVGRKDWDRSDIIQHLHQVAPAAALVVLTLCSDERIRARAQESGAQAFMEKYAGAADLLQDIRRLASRPRHQGDRTVTSSLAT